jgi:hypothetical protein
VGPGDNRILQIIYDRAKDTFGDVVPRAIGLVHGAINVFAVMVMGIYLSLHPALYREWLIALFPPIHRDLVRDVLGDLGGTLRSWIVGMLIGMFVLGTLTAIGLYASKSRSSRVRIFTGLVAIAPFFERWSPRCCWRFVSTIPGTPAWDRSDWRAGRAARGRGAPHREQRRAAAGHVERSISAGPLYHVRADHGAVARPMGLIVAVPTLPHHGDRGASCYADRPRQGFGGRRASDRGLRVPAPGGGVLLRSASPLTRFHSRKHSSRGAELMSGRSQTETPGFGCSTRSAGK